METLNERWIIDIDRSKNPILFSFTRYSADPDFEHLKPLKKYMLCTAPIASIWAESIINGFQPPQDLDHFCKLSEQTQSEQKHPGLSPDKNQDHQNTQ